MPKQGGRRKKNRTHVALTEADFDAVPKNLVVKRGEMKEDVKELVKDFRDVFYPYTATKINDNQNIKIKDMLKMAKSYHMTSISMFTSTKKSNYLRLMKMARGPTFTFRILRFSTNNDIQQNLPRAKTLSSKTLGCPLVIVNGFVASKNPAENLGMSAQERTITKTIFNNLFPGIGAAQNKPGNIKRVVLIDYNEKLDIIEFRHFYIKQNYTGINNKIKKMVNNNRIPNLGSCKDIADYFKGNVGFVSDSDVDHLPNAHIDVEEVKGDKVVKTQVKLRLYEIGPRLTLQLLKIEEGLLSGEIFYSKFLIPKNESTAESEMLRAKRREIQENNVKRKEQTKQLMEKLNKKIEKDRLDEVLRKRAAPEDHPPLENINEEPKEGAEEGAEEEESEEDIHFEEVKDGEVEDFDYDKFNNDFV